MKTEGVKFLRDKLGINEEVMPATFKKTDRVYEDVVVEEGAQRPRGRGRGLGRGRGAPGVIFFYYLYFRLLIKLKNKLNKGGRGFGRGRRNEEGEKTEE